ncbi:Gfo/Idh/MocA family protein [Rhizobium herbae]
MKSSYYLVIGSGSIARRHIKNLKTIFPNAEVACISASGRALTPEECDADTVFTSLDEALANCKPDFAIVASPSPWHLAQVRQLAEAGVPSLIEKPLADDFSLALAEMDALRPHVDQLEVAYNLRYLPSAREMKRLLDAGVLGRIHSVLIDVGQYLPDWRPQSDYRLNVSARSDLGGGVLLELSHELDYLTWLFGRFKQVYCVTGQSGCLEIDVEDRVDAVLSRDDGLVITLHMDFLQRVVTRTCKVIGENGTLIWNIATNSVSLLAPENQSKVLFSDDAYDRNAMYLSEIERFSLVAKGELKPLVSLEDALYVLRLVAAMKASARERKSVSIETLEP